MKPNTPPQSNAGDVAIVIAKAAVSAVPVVGGPVAELFDLLRTPVQRRQDDWFRDLAERIALLEESGRVTRDQLARNAAFVDAVARGVQAASRTGDPEKRAALRNAALHVALTTTADEGERELFLDMVERFTPWHLRLLKTIQNPLGANDALGMPYRPAMTSSLGAFLEALHPELRGRSPLYGRIWTDLEQAGLVNTHLGATMSADGWRERRTTILGDGFLSFIEEP